MPSLTQLLVVLLLATACGAATPSRAPEPAAETRARAFAARADELFARGELEDGLALATRALVVRLAHYGVERPEPARSFVQLGDMRRRVGQVDWARQCYVRALELAVPHERTHAPLVRDAAIRLASIYRERGDDRTADRLLERYAADQGGAAP